MYYQDTSCCSSDSVNGDYLLCHRKNQFNEVSTIICYKKHIFNKSVSRKKKMDDDEFYDLNDEKTEYIESAQFIAIEVTSKSI